MLHDLLIICYLIEKNWVSLILIAGICTLTVSGLCGAATAHILSANEQISKLSQIEE